MAVTSCNESAAPTPLVYTKDSGNTYTRTFKVVVTIAGLEGAIEASTAVDPNYPTTGNKVPAIGDLLEQSGSWGQLINPGRCTNVTPSLQSAEDDYYHYTVTCTFSQSGEDFQTGGGGGNSELSYGLSYSYDRSEVTILEAIDPTNPDKKIGMLNSAGDPFSEGYKVQIPVMTINITDVVQDFDPSVPLKHLHTINKNPITIAGQPYLAKSLMITEWSATRAIQNNLAVFQRTRKFTAAAKPFNKDYKIRVLDRGYNVRIEQPGSSSGDSGVTTQLISNTGKALAPREKRSIQLGTNGDDAKDPQLLDGYGNLLQTGVAPFFIEFEVFTSTDWGSLGIPATLPQVAE